MSEISDLRELVLSRKGQFGRLAKMTGLSTKTLSRIANGKADGVRLSTANLIREAIAKIPARDEFDAAA